MSSPIAAFLYTTNEEFREFLRRAPAGGGDAATTAQLDSLSTRLSEVSTQLTTQPFAARLDTDAVGAPTPRETLERLQETLQAVQSALLAQRARLEADRAQLQAARAWSAALKQTR